MSYESPPPSSLHSCSGGCWTPPGLWGIWPLLAEERALPATGGSRRLKHTERAGFARDGWKPQAEAYGGAGFARDGRKPQAEAYGESGVCPRRVEAAG